MESIGNTGTGRGASMARTTLGWVLDTLQAAYGEPAAALPRHPFELILWENVVYLVDDHRRAAAFERLRAEVGTQPTQLLAAPFTSLRAIAAAGLLPDQLAAKLRECARVAATEFGGDLAAVCRQPLAQARKALQRFPAIGAPGADKILLCSGSYPVFALESNGLRVLLRLGFGTEATSYAASYRAVQQAVRDQLPPAGEALRRAYQLLRQHGLETCRRSGPRCELCPLASVCDHWGSARRQRPGEGPPGHGD
jgi:endonuclease III